jgi:tetratricopeptide (TPR) repeat protein
MNLRNGMAALLVSVALFGLAGCENSKDKAARHLASALELAEKGDGDRALVEFRNVFQLDPENVEARRSFADFLRARGDLAGAYGQYLAVTERKPDDQEALRAAASVAALIANWPEAARQAKALLALVPDDPEMTAVQIGAAYAEAASKGDKAARKVQADAARALMTSRPKDLLLHRLVVDDLAQDQDFTAALAALDQALVIFPEEAQLYSLRVSLLAAMEDKPGVEAALRDMETRFDDPAVGQALLRWYVANGQIDQAEAWLRSKTAAEGDAGLQARVQMILFLKQFRTPDAALAEIDAALALVPATPAAPDAADGAKPAITANGLKVLRASILFDQGKQDEAVAAMKAILEGATPSVETRMVKVTLARMLVATGDLVQPRALVEEVLTEDPGDVEALKLKSAWLIDEDKTDESIALLRTALESAPRDAQTMALMAEAYGRAGSRDLQADMLAQAVEASGKAPGETLRYANFLAGDQKFLPAETLLVDALRLAPDNLELLAAMGDLYLRMKDWPRAEGVANRLAEIGSDQSRAMSDRLRPAILAGREDVPGAVSYLETLAGTGDQRAEVALISAYLGQGKTAEAKAKAEALLARDPKEPAARFVMAAVKGATGEGVAAVADYRALLAEEPGRADLWIALIRQTAQNDGQPKAEPVIDEALKALPDQGDLLLMKANMLELRQDIDGAIAIYDKLYALNSGNLVVANNLASLISSYKSDQPSLDRAWTVARRLNGTDVPAFADTYGWLAHLRGQSAEALPYMELAAKGLETDPMVQFHMAEVLKASGRADEAKTYYAKVLTLVPETDTRAFVATARKEAGQ